MNLYIFNNSCFGAVYGIGTYIRELTISLKRADINICVINLFSDVSHIIIENNNNIKYWSFPKPAQEYKTISTVKQWELYYRNIIYLLQLHIEDKNELIFHLNYNYSSDFQKALKNAFKCKIITCVHYLNWCLTLNGNLSDFRQATCTSQNAVIDNSKNAIYKSYLKESFFFNRVDRIVCLSEYTRNILQYDYKISTNKVDVVYNGLTDMKYYNKKLKLCMQYRIPDIPIILFVGRVDYRKGLMYALQAFRKVLNTQLCQFIVVGNGDFDLHMKECEDIWMNITWTGKLDSKKLRDIYTIADIGILPSFAEQCSYVAIEMMMHSIPIIGSASTGLNEMIEEGFNGLHIPIEERPNEVEIDTALLAEKIIYLLQNSKERERMSFNARSKYEKCYTSEIMGRKMLDIYDSMLNNG